MGAAAKGRSSSKALSRILRTSLGYVLGGGLYPGCIHCRSPWNKADAPSRDRAVEQQTRSFPLWLQKLQQGDARRFDIMVSSSFWRRPLGRWVRLLLLLAGDIERNPGPNFQQGAYFPRGELNMSVGFSQATVQRMSRCLEAFEAWTKDKLGLTLNEAMATAEMADLALRGYGRFCFSEGRPRYWLVYAITGVVHQYPGYRNLLHGAWQIDRKWQLEEPGQCRAVLSAPLVRAIIAVALLWEWRSFASIVALGFAGMLHPNEFVHLVRSDLVFPQDTLELR